MKIQVTLYDKSGKYRPVSCLVSTTSPFDKEEIKIKGIKKIMINRGWTKEELIKYNYLSYKMRRVYPENH